MHNFLERKQNNMHSKAYIGSSAAVMKNKNNTKTNNYSNDDELYSIWQVEHSISIQESSAQFSWGCWLQNVQCTESGPLIS